MCVATNGYRTSFGGDGNILEFYMIMFTQLCEYTKKKPIELYTLTVWILKSMYIYNRITLLYNKNWWFCESTIVQHN